MLLCVFVESTVGGNLASYISLGYNQEMTVIRNVSTGKHCVHEVTHSSNVVGQ